MDGFINVLKPPGMSSHDVIDVVRRIFKQKRVGHAGTLDPAAAGVLPVALGRAARLIEYMEGADKSYRAELSFGCATDTGDVYGTVTESRAACMCPSEAAIRDFLGDKGIAISDTAHRIRRLQSNAADKSLQILEPLELAALLARLPRCHAILTTGELATRTLLTLLPDTIAPAIGKPGRAVFQQRTLQLYRLPSSSRAYPLALAKKAESYRACFAAVGLIP